VIGLFKLDAMAPTWAALNERLINVKIIRA